MFSKWLSGFMKNWLVRSPMVWDREQEMVFAEWMARRGLYPMENKKMW